MQGPRQEKVLFSFPTNVSGENEKWLRIALLILVGDVGSRVMVGPDDLEGLFQP